MADTLTIADVALEALAPHEHPFVKAIDQRRLARVLDALGIDPTTPRQLDGPNGATP